MRSWFLAVLMASITMGVIGLVYIALTPKLSKHYSPKGLYTIWLVILLGLVIPIRPIFPQSLFSIKEESINRVIVLPVKDPLAKKAQGTATMPPLPNQQKGSGSLTPPLPNTVALNQLEPVSNNTQEAGLSPQSKLYNTPAPAGPVSFNLWQGAAFVWLIGALAFLLWHIAQHIRFIKKVKRWRIAVKEDALAQHFDALKKEMCIHKNIQLYHCPAISTPCL